MFQATLTYRHSDLYCVCRPTSPGIFDSCQPSTHLTRVGRHLSPDTLDIFVSSRGRASVLAISALVISFSNGV